MMRRSELIEALKAARTDINPDQDVAVDLFQPRDALGVSLAYYTVYNDSFPIEHVYDPDEVVRRNATEDQYTVVARTPAGDIVGLAGLFRHAPNPQVYEAGQLMVLKPFRKGKVGDKISRMIHQTLPKRLHLDVVFLEAVCNRSVSQWMAHQQGLRVTGLELECMPSGAYSKEGGARRNVSLLLMFKVHKDKAHAVYLPEAYAGVMTGLYKKLGLTRQQAAGSGLAGATRSEEFLLPDADFARVTVKKAGHDFEQIIDDLRARAGKDALVQVYLNLGDESVPEAAALLRQRGYFFGGLLPRWFESDGLIMQKLPLAPAWDELQLYGPDAEAMMAYVRRDYESVTRQ